MSVYLFFQTWFFICLLHTKGAMPFLSNFLLLNSPTFILWLQFPWYHFYLSWHPRSELEFDTVRCFQFMSEGMEVKKAENYGFSSETPPKALHLPSSPRLPSFGLAPCSGGSSRLALAAGPLLEQTSPGPRAASLQTGSCQYKCSGFCWLTFLPRCYFQEEELRLRDTQHSPRILSFCPWMQCF